MFMALMVMVSWVSTYSQTHQVIHIKDNQLFTCQLHFNKMVKERNEKGNERVTLCLPNFKTAKYIRFLFSFMSVLWRYSYVVFSEFRGKKDILL